MTNILGTIDGSWLCWLRGYIRPWRTKTSQNSRSSMIFVRCNGMSGVATPKHTYGCRKCRMYSRNLFSPNLCEWKALIFGQWGLSRKLTYFAESSNRYEIKLMNTVRVGCKKYGTLLQAIKENAGNHVWRSLSSQSPIYDSIPAKISSHPVLSLFCTLSHLILLWVSRFLFLS